MKFFNTIFIIAVSINMAGCFEVNPSEFDAKEAVNSSYKKFIDSGDLIVENVKKIDGVEMEINGVKVYKMNVEVTRKFPKGSDCLVNDTNSNLSKILALCAGEKTPIALGVSNTISRKVIFTKSENGWRGQYSW